MRLPIVFSPTLLRDRGVLHCSRSPLVTALFLWICCGRYFGDFFSGECDLFHKNHHVNHFTSLMWRVPRSRTPLSRKVFVYSKHITLFGGDRTMERQARRQNRRRDIHLVTMLLFLVGAVCLVGCAAQTKGTRAMSQQAHLSGPANTLSEAMTQCLRHKEGFSCWQGR